MTEKQATMQLPMDLIAPAIEAHVNAAVVEALKGSDRLVLGVVHQVLGNMVDSDGKSNGYGEKRPWLTWAVQKIVKESVEATIREQLANDAPRIKAAIESEMKKSNSKLVRSLVEAMANGMAQTIASNYKMKITFENG